MHMKTTLTLLTQWADTFFYESERVSSRGTVSQQGRTQPETEISDI